MQSTRKPISAILLALAVLAASILLAACGPFGDDDKKSKRGGDLQTVEFQEPTAAGPDPFTEPTDVQGEDTVPLNQPAGGQQPSGGGAPDGGEGQEGQGPYGGTGSDLVCDRELLIKSLKADPEKLREWARVVGIEPTEQAVEDYIRDSTPVTLTEDTQFTNHSFEDGKAVPYQAIFQKGTATLADKDGKPFARCRCGNPLREPVYYPKVKCKHCPPDYKPKKPCFYPKDGSKRNGYEQNGSDGEKGRYDYSDCYRKYPNPPPVKEEPTATPQAEPGAPQQTPYRPDQTPTEPEHEPDYDCGLNPHLPQCGGAEPRPPDQDFAPGYQAPDSG